MELGIYVAYADKLGPIELVRSHQFHSPLALGRVRTNRSRIKLWIAISCERVCI